MLIKRPTNKSSLDYVVDVGNNRKLPPAEAFYVGLDLATHDELSQFDLDLLGDTMGQDDGFIKRVGARRGGLILQFVTSVHNLKIDNGDGAIIEPATAEQMLKALENQDPALVNMILNDIEAAINSLKKAAEGDLGNFHSPSKS